MRRAALALAAIVAVAIAAAVASASDGPADRLARATPVVEVVDDQYLPPEVKIKKGKKVRWAWSDLNGNVHDVSLTSTKPKGIKRADFKSRSATIGETFTRKFKKPGKYGFVCTFHRAVMEMTVVVKKR